MPCNDTCRFRVFPCPAVVPFQQHPRQLVREATGVRWVVVRSFGDRWLLKVACVFPERRISSKGGGGVMKPN